MITTKFISIFKSVDFARRRIPLIIHDSGKAGPIVWVVAAIHGDEVTGTETVLRLNRYLKRNPIMQGKIYCLPIMNPTGYELMTRYEATESRDLNRCFPGSPQGNTAERVAYKIFSLIKSTKPTLVIDLHTDTMESIPYVYLDQVIARADAHLVDKILAYSKLTGVNYFVENINEYEEMERSISGSLLNKAKIPAFTLELGGPLLVKERFVDIGLNAIKNVLSHLNMLKKSLPQWIYPYKLSLEGIYEMIWYRYTPDYTGIVEYKVQPGDIVKKGEVLARIKNLFDKTLQLIKVTEESVIISYADQSICYPGTELFMTAARNDKAFKFVEQ